MEILKKIFLVLGEGQHLILTLGTTLGILSVFVITICQGIECYKRETLDKFSFISNIVLSTAICIIIFFQPTKTADYVDFILGYIICLALINFIRFLKDKDFKLKYYLKYFLIAGLINIIFSIVIAFVPHLIIEKLNIFSYILSIILIHFCRAVFLASGYLIYKSRSYKEIENISE